MTCYELATLTVKVGAAAGAAPAIADYVAAPEAKGRLLGAWMTEIGRLNEIIVLRGFDSRDDLVAEQERGRMSANPFGCAEMLTGLTMDGYRPFDFIPPVETGVFGPVYEIRSYITRTNGIGATQERWRKAVPTRTTYSPLIVAMYTIDGAPRFTHIWPYRSLDERQSIRAKALADGVWPPKGGADWLVEMTSTVALPLDFSPLK